MTLKKKADRAEEEWRQMYFENPPREEAEAQLWTYLDFDTEYKRRAMDLTHRPSF